MEKDKKLDWSCKKKEKCMRRWGNRKKKKGKRSMKHCL